MSRLKRPSSRWYGVDDRRRGVPDQVSSSSVDHGSELQDSDDENEINNTVPVPTTSEKGNTMNIGLNNQPDYNPVENLEIERGIKQLDPVPSNLEVSDMVLANPSDIVLNSSYHLPKSHRFDAKKNLCRIKDKR
ncbi:hypothetical protein TNCV_2896461 [Trichonephila clavipes]|nr:hypothetical protein TNCV_2896461 [Trichonephila clavipes]